ncbi:MAG: sigma-54 dependent transcriptional regulator [Ignavibacteria bacterium]|nr:sigma-54 dependent transcriptional regulator [Ignavibacteria bacterium]
MGMRILIIDDDNLVCLSLKRVLSKFGYDVSVCMEAANAFQSIDLHQPDIILLDIYLTTHDGLELLRDIQKQYYHIPVIMITGYSDVQIAVRAMKSGAYDFLLKPIDLEQLKVVLNRVEIQLGLKNEVSVLRGLAMGNELSREHFGKSKVIHRVISIIEKLAGSGDTTILLEGESGTGKEVVAKFIHQKSPRANNVFIPINCAAIPKELAESELFGHEKGAFTGAAQRTKPGKFELADKGTILLDEIGELSLDLQVKLLRVLQEKRFYRLGGEKEITVDVRVIAATNRNLEEEVKKGTFREDLYYRLNVAKVIIPPLRERREDIRMFTFSFIDEFSQKFNKTIKVIDEETLALLENQYWKGNIRELRNAVERAMLLLDSEEVKEHHFNFLQSSQEAKENRDNDTFVLKIPREGISIDVVLKNLILQTLEITKGNQVKAAKVLGLSRSKLRYRMEQLGIEVTKKIG